MVLNGQGRFREADEHRERILRIWEKHYKADWIAKGSPASRAKWARIMVPAKEYNVAGAEYFQPQVIGSPPATITTFYEIIAFPKYKKQKRRVFKLEMSKIVEEYYVLREYFTG